MTSEYDAIVVGARVAGAATAALLARQGAQVLLVDRATLPAPTVSCPVFFGNSLAVFERIGVLQDIENIGAPRIRFYGGRSPTVDLVGRLPPAYGRDYGYAIRRDVLDTTILERVRAYDGITVREGFTVTDLVWSMGRVVGIRGRQQHGSAEETLYARAVVGADGKRSFVARAVEAPIYATYAARTCLFYAYYRDFAPLDEPGAIVYINPDNRTTALICDADAGLTVVCVALPAEQFETARKDPAATLEGIWRSFPEVARRGRMASRDTRVMGQGPVDSFYRQSYGPGWALVGDAGHYIDPTTGQGINNALHSAELFAEAWRRTRGRVSWQNAMDWYQQQRDAITRPMYNMLALGERFAWFAKRGIDIGTPLMQAIARRPDVTSRYVGMYNGATPVHEFLHPLHLTRIMVEDRIYYGVPRHLRTLSRHIGKPRMLRQHP